MSRPHENRIRRVVHVLPVTDAHLQKLAEKHGTFGRAIDAMLGVPWSAGRRGAGRGAASASNEEGQGS